MSQEVFKNFFNLDYDGQDVVKKCVAISELDSVFGRNWHIYIFPKSSTRKRIIGIVLLHYRRKLIEVQAVKANRYVLAKIVIF